MKPKRIGIRTSRLLNQTKDFRGNWLTDKKGDDGEERIPDDRPAWLKLGEQDAFQSHR